jgi:hypothetical protein
MANSLINKLKTTGSPLSYVNGATPKTMAGATWYTPLHKTYSINGKPPMMAKPLPSKLDLNGITPPKYSDNLPG